MPEADSVDARRLTLPLVTVIAAIPSILFVYTTFFSGDAAHADGQTTAEEALRQVGILDQKLIENARQLSAVMEQVQTLTIVNTRATVRLEQALETIETAAENIGENRERLIRIEANQEYAE